MSASGEADTTVTSGGRVLATFFDLVRIDSPSGAENEVADYCERLLASCGATVVRDGSAKVTGSDTGNLFATLPGTAPGLTLVFSGHMDCVQPCIGVEPVVSDGIVSSAGETVLGADDKAGLAAILELFRRLAEDGRPHPELRVVLTVSEELGLVGAKALDRALLAGELCLVLDADGPPGNIIVSSPTHYTYEAVFRGRSAHAGVEPEAGISAIAMAARAIAAIPHGRLDDKTTANVGTIAGGRANNVVAETATVTGECRSRDRQRVEELRAEIERAMREAAERAGGELDLRWMLEYEGITFAEDDPRLGLVVRACERAGITPRTVPTGGGSDGNILAADGIPTIVLSCGMTAVHSTSETLRVADLDAMVALLEALVAEALESV